MKRNTLIRRQPMARGAKPIQRTPMKRNRPKKRPGHDPKMLNACRGEPCYLRIPGVCHGAAGADTVVPAHSNQEQHGKGAGLKARDEFTVPGCFWCHSEIDQGKRFTQEEKFAFWNTAFYIWAPRRALKLSPLGRAACHPTTTSVWSTT